MTTTKKHLEELKKEKLSAIIRTDDYDHAYKIIKACNEAAIKFIEITLTVPNAYKLIEQTSKDFPNLSIGAGTVLTIEQAQKSLEAGAKYFVSPVCLPELVKWSKEKGILCMAGAITPTEMFTLWEAGAELIKFFPANSMPKDYIKLVKNPHTEFQFIATGGINYNNCLDYIEAGCIAVGVSADLGSAPITKTYEEILEVAKKYKAKLK
ncbi:bifunctional 4-hydroxy-2-oxoglutarate aldolase/2-dehydro-3-deoxy-phosphogluconate aldolase [Mesoplasma melaleucae]|uniref:2-dehydro-3-deoxy-phosphogluconate aldolase n=1 Tax=Mesoplasma melaleucae TaxID=81459 RepID=A0A2K8NWQ9_9MOLU|nr:bifunctional 4-hydroxy-2-oxoglutarate aldolase/2-dehydro-3-deoxy-phosphogluconate aldolase [Mesoplasma melaleucae]ATZ17638.1 2-dehydro-3-deoxy-phosphogluconate aldolase [Mesoplasma melaleucae]